MSIWNALGSNNMPLEATTPEGLNVTGTYKDPGFVEQAATALNPISTFQDAATAYNDGRYLDSVGNAALGAGSLLPIGKGIGMGYQAVKPFLPGIGQGIKAGAQTLGKGINTAADKYKASMAARESKEAAYRARLGNTGAGTGYYKDGTAFRPGYNMDGSKWRGGSSNFRSNQTYYGPEIGWVKNPRISNNWAGKRGG